MSGLTAKADDSAHSASASLDQAYHCGSSVNSSSSTSLSTRTVSVCPGSTPGSHRCSSEQSHGPAFDAQDLEVRLTFPYEAFVFFDVANTQRSLSSGVKVGRNDPCPCGSGRKYKKCHLAADEAERASQREIERDHDVDAELARELTAYAIARFEFEWRGFMDDFSDPEWAIELAVPWSIYHYRIQEQTVLEWFLAEHGSQITRTERGWLTSQQAAWLSVWEVIGVEPGEGVTLRDLLSYEERCVRDVSASQTLVLRDALLARVVDHDGTSLVCGIHPWVHSPADAAEVVRRARGRLRRKRAVPVERLCDEAFGRYMIGRWEEAIEELEWRDAVPRELHNTDGDPLLLTTDHFAFEPASRAEIERRLAEMEGATAQGAEFDSGEGGSFFTFLSPSNPKYSSMENTVVGHVCVEERTLTLDTNSRERADAMRARVEAACGALLRHRVREHVDPLSPAAQLTAAALPPPPPEAGQLVLEFKRRHYADWVDHSLPALGGRTPREAVRTAEGRNAVDVLIKEMENLEQRGSDSHAFDFGEIRRQLEFE